MFYFGILGRCEWDDDCNNGKLCEGGECVTSGDNPGKIC